MRRTAARTAWYRGSDRSPFQVGERKRLGLAEPQRDVHFVDCDRDVNMALLCSRRLVLDERAFPAHRATGDGQRRVDDTCRQSRNRSAVNVAAMDVPFITGRPALDAAAELIERFGDDAGLEAAARAERSRDNDNVVGFCHWRQIERVIATLSSEEVRGTLH